jgi:nitroreductase
MVTTASTAVDTGTIDVATAVAAAIHAPSMHNSQPWRFRVRSDAVDVRLDPERQLPASDPSGWAGRLACGAAVFNLRVALAVQGVQATVTLRPDPADPDLMARVSFGERRRATPAEHQLWAAIPRRHSNRAPFWPDRVPAAARAALTAAAGAEGGWLELLIGVGPVAALAEIAQAANRVLLRNPGYRAEVAAWTRDGNGSAGHVEDGVPAAAGGPSSEPQDLLPGRPFGTLIRPPGRDFEPEPLVAVLGTAGDTTYDQLTAGQVLQRVLLTATDLGLAVSMLSQPIEVASAREQLRLALGRYGTPQMVLRIGYGQQGLATPRRPVSAVIDDSA